MTRSALVFAVAGTLLGGCFYTDSINQRPSISIRQTSSDEAYRGAEIALEAESDDPEGQVVWFQWRAYLCTDTEALPTGERPNCDQVPFHTEVLEKTHFTVPSTRDDGVTPVQAILVILEAQDDYGAIARPHQELVIPISNRAPDLEVTMRSQYDYVVNTPLDVYAKVGDLDDGPAKAQLTYVLFKPPGGDANLTPAAVDVPDDDPTRFLQEGWTFTPDVVGRWEFQVTATDPVGAMTQKSAVIDVVPDHAPCLAQSYPALAPAGSTRPLTDATLFQVNIVTDDLDPYPAVQNDSLRKTTTFAWSMKVNSGARTDLSASGNAAALDPANFAPGDIIELRVEIADRAHDRPINCADDIQTCSVISDNTCIQRQTWLVEVH